MIKAQLKKDVPIVPITEEQFKVLGYMCEGFTPFDINEGIKWAKFRFIQETGKYVLDKFEGQAMDFYEIKEHFERKETYFEDISDSFYRLEKELKPWLKLQRDMKAMEEYLEKQERKKKSSFLHKFSKFICH